MEMWEKKTEKKTTAEVLWGRGGGNEVTGPEQVSTGLTLCCAFQYRLMRRMMRHQLMYTHSNRYCHSNRLPYIANFVSEDSFESTDVGFVDVQLLLLTLPMLDLHTRSQ